MSTYSLTVNIQFCSQPALLVRKYFWLEKKHKQWDLWGGYPVESATVIFVIINFVNLLNIVCVYEWVWTGSVISTCVSVCVCVCVCHAWRNLSDRLMWELARISTSRDGMVKVEYLIPSLTCFFINIQTNIIGYFCYLKG